MLKLACSISLDEFTLIQYISLHATVVIPNRAEEQFSKEKQRKEVSLDLYTYFLFSYSMLLC